MAKRYWLLAGLALVAAGIATCVALPEKRTERVRLDSVGVGSRTVFFGAGLEFRHSGREGSSFSRLANGMLHRDISDERGLYGHLADGHPFDDPCYVVVALQRHPVGYVPSFEEGVPRCSKASSRGGSRCFTSQLIGDSIEIDVVQIGDQCDDPSTKFKYVIDQITVR